MRRFLACLFFWLAVWLSTGCAYKLRQQQSAQRTEQETSTFQAAASVAEKQHSVETKKSATKRVVEKFRPDGSLMERLTEQHDSDGKVVTETDSASQSTAAGGAFRSVVASSSSTRASDTRVGVNPWFWLLLLVPVGVAGWLLRKWLRSRIPFL